MNESANTYKKVIDKELLFEFLMCEGQFVHAGHVKEVTAVIDIVMNKHYNAFPHLFDDLRAAALLYITAKKTDFDPDKDAYNYIYTRARNEVGNNIYRWTKETRIEDNPNFREPGACDDDMDSDLPPACLKYKHYLTGEAEYTVHRIASKDVPDIILWLRVSEDKKTPEPPSYLLRNKASLKILYKLLKDIISTE